MFMRLLLGLLILSGCATHRESPGPSSSATTETRSVVQRYFAAVENGDAALAASLFAADAEYEDVTFDFAIRGVPAIRNMLNDAIIVLNPVQRRIVRQAFDGDQAAIEWEARGIHAAAVLGFPPSHRPITIRAVSLITVRDGRIQAVRDYTDRAGLETQLRRNAEAAS